MSSPVMCQAAYSMSADEMRPFLNALPGQLVHSITPSREGDLRFTGVDAHVEADLDATALLWCDNDRKATEAVGFLH